MKINRIYVLFIFIVLSAALLISPAAADGNETETNTTVTNTTVTSTISSDISAGSTWDNYLVLTYSGSINGGTADSWEWNFGDDSGTSTTQSGTYTYSETGSYTVSLTVTSSDSEITDATIDDSVTISEPDFNASADIEMSESSLLIDYDSTTEGAESWEWDFGDGEGTSTYESGSYTYDDTGTYQVTLTATSPAGDTDTYYEYITFSAAPEACFTVDNTTGSSPLYVEFTDDSEENPYTGEDIVEWYWEFGDDDGSYYHAYEDDDDDPDTSFTFEDEGTYTVTLTVTDDDDEEDTYEVEIVVDDDVSPEADFSVDDDYDTEGSAPLTVAFVDESDESDDTGAEIIAWYWVIYDEDGDKYDYSTAQDPEFTFEDEGEYTVTLTVTDEEGMSDTETKEDYIEVTLDLSATFTASPTSGYKPLTVNFYATDGSDNEYDIDYYYWYFGDGLTNLGSDDSPSHTYTSPGTYDVKLIVIDEKDNRYTYERDNYIVVTGTNTVTTTPTATVTPTPQATESADDTLLAVSSSAGTKIFGLPGTEYFRTEITRFHEFYSEYLSLITGVFGMK
ncbi:PKD domain-containing protein [Methanoplanus endosymbiosus]|uniref:PKD domain-containing protein n=1 Tax=Methanoplanus endosymbiosus TaxID=33865 RepID=A0A9E7PJN1_9EURY|nr:PKD domain-containing protein [Methanoplanus endosymbiosus]UUX91163.1 PKD domain-containing protein [Methanoplanus endosymbiosus]